MSEPKLTDKDLTEALCTLVSRGITNYDLYFEESLSWRRWTITFDCKELIGRCIELIYPEDCLGINVACNDIENTGCDYSILGWQLWACRKSNIKPSSDWLNNINAKCRPLFENYESK